MPTPTSSDSDLESKLSGFVHSYFHAVQAGDCSEQEEALRWVCAGLEYLLGSLLEGCDGWSGWVDGIFPATDYLPDAITAVSAVELNVRGSALWGKRAEGQFWIEPFLAYVRASDTADSIISYEVKFGDAVRGLGTHPCGKHIRQSIGFVQPNGCLASRRNRIPSAPLMLSRSTDYVTLRATSYERD